MSARSLVIATTGIICLFGLGALLGRALSSRTQAAALVEAQTVAQTAQKAAAAAPSPLDAETARAVTLHREVSELQAELASMKRPVEASAESAPLPFPEGLPEHLSRNGFDQAFRELFRICPSELELLETDCSEYPCIAWARSRDHKQTGPSEALNRCAAWKARYPNAVTYMFSGTPNGEREERYHFFIPVPPGGDRAVNQPILDAGARRVEARWAAMDP